MPKFFYLLFFFFICFSCKSTHPLNEIAHKTHVETKPGSDSYLADASSGTVYKASSDPSTANGGSLQQPKASDKALSYAVTFAPHVRQLYGFDLPGEKHPEGNYKTQSMGGNNVLIPWKSVETGQIDRVMATLGAEADTAIHFITQSGNMVMVAPGDKTNLQTPASSSNSIFKQLLIAGTQNDDQLKAWYTAPGDTTKKPERVLAAVANVVAYDKQTAPVYIVEINGAVAPDASYIQTYLNSVYAPAIANFTVSKKAFTTSITSPFDNTLTDEMNYNKAQDALIKAFKNSEGIDKKALYLFFIKENTTHSDIKGHMPFNRSFGFIYAANQSITELTRTMAHELGHGAFRLKHTFSNENNFIQTEKQTDNLMDYASGSELLKYQWDECHDFDLGCNWFEDGDEAAYENKDLIKLLQLRIIEKLSNSSDLFPKLAFDNQKDLTTIVIFNLTDESGGKYINGKLIIGTGKKHNKTDEDILSTIYHEFMHYFNAKIKLFPYRMENIEEGLIYTKLIKCYEERLQSNDEYFEEAFDLFLTYRMGKGDKSVIDYPAFYKDLNENQKKEVEYYIDKEKIVPQKICFIFQYLPSNYFKDELNAHTETLKANNLKVFIMSNNKIEFYNEEIARYEKLYNKASIYENKFGIDEKGYEK